MVLNDGALAASNSLLCGFLRAGYSAEQFAAAWYTSLTLLWCELRVHSLGGGVLVLIPGEVATIRLPPVGRMPTAHLGAIDRALKSAKGDPYQLGDEPVLIQALRLTAREVELIREGRNQLKDWRKGAVEVRTPAPGLGEYVKE